MDENWIDVGPTELLRSQTLQRHKVGRLEIALSCVGEKFGAVHNVCNHAGGPLGEGALDGDYIVCPWHQWKFHRVTGLGEPGFEDDRVPAFPVKVESGRVLIDVNNATGRHRAPHAPHPLARPIVRADGPIRVAGLSTTAMDQQAPRYSGSDDLLQSSLKAAAEDGCDTRLIRLNDLKFRACEGYYSKSARACTWPCSITQMHRTRRGLRSAGSLGRCGGRIDPDPLGAGEFALFQDGGRLNCIQNQVTTHNRVMIRNKVAAFIIVGGQDNVQGVAGQLLGFFSELGFHFPQFPFIAHSRGWSAEDMERNVVAVRDSASLHDGAAELARRAVELSTRLLDTAPVVKMKRGGRKAHENATD